MEIHFHFDDVKKTVTRRRRPQRRRVHTYLKKREAKEKIITLGRGGVLTFEQTEIVISDLGLTHV